MDEIEKFFKCPFCFERISMLLDAGSGELQSYTEDCEVCCNPILLHFQILDGKVKNFSAEKAYG